VKQYRLSESTVSSSGRILQALLKDQFSESYMNKILRLILNHRVTGGYPENIFPPDTVVCPYQVNLFLPPAVKAFLKYSNDLAGRFKEKPYIIMLEILPGVSTEKSSKMPVEPQALYKLLESLVFFIKKGVQVVKFCKTETPERNVSAGISQENLLHALIANVIQEISPSACIITGKHEMENHQHLLAELNKFLLQRKKAGLFLRG
jgi:hypothetical protein